MVEAGGLERDFIEKQRERLERLREELRGTRRGVRGDARERGEEERDVQPDSGDQSQQMFERELDETLDERAQRRLADVERALEKIEEGTYGVCDDTGEPIPRGRLEAVPEAVRTVEAQERVEQGRRPGR